MEAWYIDAYRVEFSIDTGSPYESKHEYSAEEIEKWAREQKEMEDYVQGDYRCVPRDIASAMIQECIAGLVKKFSVREQFEKEDAELTAEQKQAQLLAQEKKYGDSGVPGWEEAKKSYNELKDK